MKILNFQFTLQMAAAISLLFSASSNAQDLPVFLKDVTSKGQIEHRIYHLQVARELANRTMLINKCVNSQESISDPRFDAFSEALLKNLGSSDPKTLTIFTVRSRFEEAAIQNDLTDTQIEVIAKIMRSPRYSEFIDYLSFEGAALEIATGFDITGERAPWIASLALSFLRQSQFFPLLRKDLSKSELALIENRLLDGARPSQQITDNAYLEDLASLFQTQLDNGFIREKLPKETKILLDLYQSLGIEAMRGSAAASIDTPPETRHACKSKKAVNCIDEAWFTASIALHQQLETDKYKTASAILKDQFADVCKVTPQAN